MVQGPEATRLRRPLGVPRACQARYTKQSLERREKATICVKCRDDALDKLNSTLPRTVWTALIRAEDLETLGSIMPPFLIAQYATSLSAEHWCILNAVSSLTIAAGFLLGMGSSASKQSCRTAFHHKSADKHLSDPRCRHKPNDRYKPGC